MAHVVGVLKRDPCHKCQLPVFLAERMAVDKRIYHRTCLKCARCRTQLTPGSFYETEVDDEYCCETCPDEEIEQDVADKDELLLRGNAYDDNGAVTRRSVRSSIADRLAFFEKSGGVEEPVVATTPPKNVSDEEKMRTDTTAVSKSAFKMSSAFTNYLNDVADGEVNEEKPAIEADSENNSITAATDIEIVPELPATPAPAPADRRFTTTAQLQMSTANNYVQDDNLQENYEKPLPKAKLKYNLNLNIVDSDTDLHTKTNNTDIITTDQINNNDELKLVAEIDNEKLETHVNDENEKALDNKNYVEAVTKDLSENHKVAEVSQMNIDDNFQQIRTELQQLDTESSTDEEQAELSTGAIMQQEEATMENQSVVHKRLLQFELKNQAEKQVEITVTKDGEVEVPAQQCILTDIAETPIETALSDEKAPKTAVVEENNFENTQASKSMQHEPKENEETKLEAKEHVDENQENLLENKTKTLPVKINAEIYPEDLNPFKSDDENEQHENDENKKNAMKSKDNSNPFDSSDDEIELEKLNKIIRTPASSGKVPPPRPPPPRISRNPFGDETGSEGGDEVTNFSRRSSLSSSLTKKTPVPTPRSNISQSSTPEPTPRISNKAHVISNNTTPLNNTYLHDSLQNSDDYYGSANSLSVHATPQHMARNSDMRGSSISLSSSAGGTTRSRKKFRAPLPPTQNMSMSMSSAAVKELFPSNETLNSSKTSTPSSSNVSSPKSARKKRMAPAPPKPARLDPSVIQAAPKIATTQADVPKNSLTYPLQSESKSKMCDEEKALLEGNKLQMASATEPLNGSKLRVIPLDASLLADNDDDHNEFNLSNNSQCDDSKQRQLHAEYEESAVVYRRAILPLPVSTPTRDENPLLQHLNATQHDRQLEKLKDNKETQNRNRQSQFSGSEEIDALMSSLMLGYNNKSAQGKWKRRKGPAPALPVPPKKVLQMLPLQEIRHELDIIEVQQQGLEKQGVILEQMIRDRCEGVPHASAEQKLPAVQNSKEVEDLILQLFELVNEKNELFRRQAELMYLRRQHRLEQEQADLEYEIRVLMAQPERNKTDSDKSREEALIARMVEVVQLRNEVIECLEMDRLREAEEDMSIKTSLEEHNAKREGATEAHRKSNAKLSKKEKKKQKEAKKLGKSKKIDADKDADETELNEKQLKKNKKKKFPFLGSLVSTSN